MKKKRLTFKAFYELFLLNNTPLNQIESINQLFFGSRTARKISDSSASKTLKDDFRLNTRHCYYKKYLTINDYSKKARYIKGLHLDYIPENTSELCQKLCDYELSIELIEQINTELDKYVRLAYVLNYALIQTCFSHTDGHSVPKAEMAHNTSQSQSQISRLHDSLRQKDSIAFCKEPLRWYLHMLSEHQEFSLSEHSRKAAALLNQYAEQLNGDETSGHILEFPHIQDICDQIGVSLAAILYCYENRQYLKESPELIRTLCNIPEASLPSNTASQSDTEPGLSYQIDDPSLQSIMGDYYCYFSSTNSKETKERKKLMSDKTSKDDRNKALNDIFTKDHIYSGILSIKPSDSVMDKRCHAYLRFMVNPEADFFKEYSGTVAVSNSKQAIFIQLQSEKESEMTFLILEFPTKSKKRCAFGFALTISSRIHHRKPCVERIFICQDEFEYDSEPYKIMKANLMMHDKFIRIDTTGYNEVIKELKESADAAATEIANKYPTLESIGPENIVEQKKLAYIKDTHILNLANLTDKQKIIFETSLRIHSIAPWYMKTNSKKVWLLMEDFIE